MKLTTNDFKVLGLLYEDMNGEHFGLSISKETKLSISLLYPILDKLQNADLINTKWEEERKNRRPRLFYFIVSKGIKAYEEYKALRLGNTRVSYA